MKNILVVIFAIFLFSCENQDKDTVEPQVNLNTFSTKKNAVNWSGITEIRLNNETDTLTFLGIANRPNDEVVVMKIKFQGLGTYSLTQKQAYYYTTVGGDVLVSKYDLTPGATGQFVISKYDQEKQVVEGNFDLDLKNTWSYSGQDTEIVKLTAGKYKGTITN